MALTIDKFVRRVTARAKAHQHAMRGMTRDAAFKYIRQIIADSEVDIGLYPDPAEPHGISVYPIKGRRQLEALWAGGIPEGLHCDAVPCVGLEHAIAAERLFGDKAN